MTPKHQGVKAPAEQKGGELDINATPYERFSLRITKPEDRALDQISDTLKWDYDLPTTKYDLIRLAIHCLADNHHQAKEASEVLKRRRQKK